MSQKRDLLKNVDAMTMAENQKINKLLYKIMLLTLKILPMLTALFAFLNILFSYFEIDAAIISYIGGHSVLSLSFMYIVSYTFEFCEYHRMFLHYTLITSIINIYDWYIGIPISTMDLFLIHFIIAGVCLFIILYLYVKCHKRITIRDSR